MTEAKQEILAGDPGRSAHQWLAWVVLVTAVLFAIDTYLVATQSVLPFDLPVELAVQRFNWGPMTFLFDAINWTGGWRQQVAGAIAIVLMMLWERRAGWLMLIGSLSSFFDNEIKLMMARGRPTPDLVHILTPAPGFSYPSGHAVFFTWLSFMVALAIAPRIPPRVRWLPWAAAAFVAISACIARVWAGDHWPTDVMGGFLLGLGWSAFVMWVPERYLPQPSMRWIRGRVRRNPAT